MERGDQVRVLVRRPEQATNLVALGVEIVKGDLSGSAESQASLDAALRGIDVVYHLAGATVPVWSRTYWLVNAEGTRLLAEACVRQPQPPIFVYVSSLAAVGPARAGHLCGTATTCHTNGSHKLSSPLPSDRGTGFPARLDGLGSPSYLRNEAGQPLTESCPARPVSNYGRSKLAAERYLRELANRLPVTILRPPIVFGPGDRYGLKLFSVAQSGHNVVAGPVQARHSWIHVADLVEAMLLAAQRGQRLAADQKVGPEEQGVYFVALDDRPTMLEVANLAAEVQGGRIRRTWHIPNFLCWVAARLNNLRILLTGRGYWFNSDKVREILAGSWICSADKAKRELGFVCRMSLAEGFRATSQWYHEHGWLQQKDEGRRMKAESENLS